MSPKSMDVNGCLRTAQDLFFRYFKEFMRNHEHDWALTEANLASGVEAEPAGRAGGRGRAGPDLA